MTDHRTYQLEVSGNLTTALERTITTLRRRRCIVVGLQFTAYGDQHAGVLTVTMDTPPAREDTVAAWLSNLVDVTSVRRSSLAARRRTRRARLRAASPGGNA
jgi:acetolactate synthase regulatory subunit